MNKDILTLLVAVGGGYLLLKYWQDRQPAMEPKFPQPPGTKPTGKVQRTTGGAPGVEVSGFKIQDWAEVVFPTGEVSWVEVKIGKGR